MINYVYVAGERREPISVYRMLSVERRENNCELYDLQLDIFFCVNRNSLLLIQLITSKAERDSIITILFEKIINLRAHDIFKA